MAECPLPQVVLRCVKSIGKDTSLGRNCLGRLQRGACSSVSFEGSLGWMHRKSRLQAGMHFKGQLRLREGVGLVTSCRASDEPHHQSWSVSVLQQRSCTMNGNEPHKDEPGRHVQRQVKPQKNVTPVP